MKYEIVISILASVKNGIVRLDKIKSGCIELFGFTPKKEDIQFCLDVLSTKRAVGVPPLVKDTSAKTVKYTINEKLETVLMERYGAPYADVIKSQNTQIQNLTRSVKGYLSEEKQEISVKVRNGTANWIACFPQSSDNPDFPHHKIGSIAIYAGLGELFVIQDTSKPGTPVFKYDYELSRAIMNAYPNDREATKMLAGLESKILEIRRNESENWIDSAKRYVWAILRNRQDAGNLSKGAPAGSKILGASKL